MRGISDRFVWVAAVVLVLLLPVGWCGCSDAPAAHIAFSDDAPGGPEDSGFETAPVEGPCVPDCSGKVCGASGCPDVQCGQCPAGTYCGKDFDCHVGECDPGSRSCISGGVATCLGETEGWSAPEPCSEPLVCIDGGCVQPQQECLPGSATCFGGSVAVCSSDGSGWGPPLPCPAGHKCSGGLCVSTVPQDCKGLLQCMLGGACPDPNPSMCFPDCFNGAPSQAVDPAMVLYSCMYGACGKWGPGEACYNNQQITGCAAALAACNEAACVPSCTGKQCGPDGCGGTCGSCGPGATCLPTGTCQGCTPQCAGKQCGADGCGGSCGDCAPGQGCSNEGLCQGCQPNCFNKQCGPDGCGGVCGFCPGQSICSVQGLCVCQPACGGKQCGPDGCGGSCGTCGNDTFCNDQGLCQGCQPDCWNKQCGPDGCGGSCGNCGQGQSCTPQGHCQGCQPDCWNKQCGPDGCGGLCGSCPDGVPCVGGSCQAPKSGCAYGLNCAIQCNFAAECTWGCYQQMDEQGQELLEDLATCVGWNCPGFGWQCIQQVLNGDCADEYWSCANDT
ncbi:MAG: hypothetical protein FJ109_09585 [Deltaproteobacteria bacterium]|nr:hypothetical protein [Deltaproteobacteria bacterium]